jgi:hypothetical protein
MRILASKNEHDVRSGALGLTLCTPLEPPLRSASRPIFAFFIVPNVASV